MKHAEALLSGLQFWAGRQDLKPHYEERRLSNVAWCYQSQAAVASILDSDDPVIYKVESYESHGGVGELNTAICRLQPGRVGGEYYMTVGHFHDPADCAEVYLVLGGRGKLLLQSQDGQTEAIDLYPGLLVYVPANHAHRSVNTGDEELFFIGIYPGNAGHDYGSIRSSGFRLLVMANGEQPKVVAKPDLRSVSGAEGRKG